MRFSNILLILSTRRAGQALALHRAAAFARAEGALLTVCEVVDWVVPEIPRYMADGSAQILTEAIRANKIQRLHQLVATCGASDLNISIELFVGKPHTEVARVVREHRYDLVIKPFAGHRALRFFSGAQEDRDLIRSCPCPVWLINVAEQDDKKCILAAMDMPTEADTETELNQRIVEISRSIALAESRPLHFVHAWRLRGEGHLRAQCNPATDLQVDRMRSHEATKRKAWLQKTVAERRPNSQRLVASEITPELHVANGHAKKVVPEFAEKLQAGLIIVGTAARTGLSGFVRRNTAETILPRSDCSLLIVRKSEAISTRALKAKRTLQTL